ncbi:MAG: hypothetical protein HQL38_15980 [Alphaproteobacteria bacterium]|nr:hypothetical protein [Alphaproteobacteria bacterium]
MVEPRAGEDVGRGGGEMTTAVVDAASDVFRAGGERAMSEVRSYVREAMESQKGRAAAQLGGVAAALHDAARRLDEGNQEVPARYTDLAAEQVERLSRVLEERSFDRLMSDAEDLARRQPALFIGGAAAAGFMLARLLRNASGASAAEPERSTMRRSSMESETMAQPSPVYGTPGGATGPIAPGGPGGAAG